MIACFHFDTPTFLLIIFSSLNYLSIHTLSSKLNMIIRRNDYDSTIGRYQSD